MSGYPGVPPQGYPGGPPQGYPGGPPQGYPGGPPQGYPGGPPQGYPGAPPQGYPGGPPQGYPGAPAQPLDPQVLMIAAELPHHFQTRRWIIYHVESNCSSTFYTFRPLVMPKYFDSL